MVRIPEQSNSKVTYHLSQTGGKVTQPRIQTTLPKLLLLEMDVAGLLSNAHRAGALLSEILVSLSPLSRVEGWSARESRWDHP